MADSASSTEPRRSSAASMVMGMAVAGGGLLASWRGEELFRGFVALVAVLVARELLWILAQERFLHAWPATAGAVAFPLLARPPAGDAGVIGAAVVLSTGAVLVARGLRPGVVKAMGTYLFVAFYAGLLSSYLPLIREASQGVPFVGVLVTMLAAYRVGTLIPEFRRAREERSESPTWAGSLSGILASGLGALGASVLLDPGVGLLAMGAVGLVCGIAAVAGDLVRSIVASEGELVARMSTLPGKGGLVSIMHAVLLAAPAFYYSFRIYTI